jgi:hypothetical protein
MVQTYNQSGTLYNDTIPYNGSAAPAPAPPILSAVGAQGEVNLSWTASSGATSYNLYRSTVSGGETLLLSGLGSLSYVDVAVTPGQSYYYEVTAVNAAGESAKSNEVSAQASAAPSGGQSSGGAGVGATGAPARHRIVERRMTWGEKIREDLLREVPKPREPSPEQLKEIAAFERLQAQIARQSMDEEELTLLLVEL